VLGYYIIYIYIYS